MIKIVPVSVSQPGVKGGGKYRFCGSIQLLALGIKSCHFIMRSLFLKVLGLRRTFSVNLCLTFILSNHQSQFTTHYFLP